ncbi:MAG: stage II sporulation protein P [Clostridia bacterium]|nr:stage II sporulation protein P [Clostridia bacterium]
MVRIKVVKASRLLLAASILALLAVLALLGARLLADRRQPAVSPSANLVYQNEGDEAKTDSVFASSNQSASAQFSLDPEPITIEVISETPQTEPFRVLIYHTHTHEAYEQVTEDPYEALEAWRTTDADHSVVRVGTELAKQLEHLGFQVVHDTTDHEGRELSTAYTRSLETLESYPEPFDLYIDLHRDAFVQGEDEPYALSDGVPSAQLMLLIGNGKGFEVKPWYAQNYAFAQVLSDRVNQLEPGICKPVMVKDGRYNQNIGVFSILVEVGHNRNTLQEALNAVPALAGGLYSLLVEAPDPALTEMKAAYDQEHAA